MDAKADLSLHWEHVPHCCCYSVSSLFQGYNEFLLGFLCFNLYFAASLVQLVLTCFAERLPQTAGKVSAVGGIEFAIWFQTEHLHGL